MKKIGKQLSKNGSHQAFTLVELLIVIAVIGIIAGFIFPVVKSVKRWQYLKTASAELNHLQTALENFKAQYGAYPPGNPNSVLLPQLYYELAGTKKSGVNYTTLDNGRSIRTNDVPTAYGVAGFINCGNVSSSEDAAAAKIFLPGLRSKEIYNPVINNGVSTTILITSVGGPDAAYQPLGISGVNPFRYVYPGVNNPGGYDLWVQLVINGQTNLVCNWSRQVQINNALP